jgi:hypothetical protein
MPARLYCLGTLQVGAELVAASRGIYEPTINSAKRITLCLFILSGSIISLLAALARTQETFDAGLKLLPRFSVVHLMRLALRATATAAMRAFGPEGVKGYNLFAVEKLSINVATIERFAGRWVV